MTKKQIIFALIVLLGVIGSLISQFSERLFNGVSVIAQDLTEPCVISTTDFAITASGALLAIYDDVNNSILLYDNSQSMMLAEIEITQDRVTDIAFSSDEQMLVWGASNVGIDDHLFNGSVYYYNTETQSIANIGEDLANVVTDLYIPEMPNFVVFRGQYPGYERADIQILDIETGNVDLIREAWRIIPAHSDNSDMMAMGLTVSLGISNEFKHQVELFSLATNEVFSIIELPEDIQSLAFQNSIPLLAYVNNDNNLFLWDIERGELVDTPQVESVSVHRLAITDDGFMVVKITDLTHDRLLLWSLDELQAPRFVPWSTLTGSLIIHNLIQMSFVY